MLSNPPTSSLHARQRHHRRQASTPSAFEGVKIPNLPNSRQAAGHRRGLSLDIRRQHTTPQTARQDYRVSINTNTGIAHNSQHRVLREAQQQRLQARPAPQQHPYASLAVNDSENYLISPHGTPHTQRFDPSCFDPSSVPFDPYAGQLNVMMQKNQGNYMTNMSGSKEFDLFSNDSAQSTPTFMNFPESPSAQGWISEGSASSSRRSSRRISNGIMDRVSKFENLVMEEPQTPATPPQNGQFIHTPCDCFDRSTNDKFQITIPLHQWALLTAVWSSKNINMAVSLKDTMSQWKKPLSLAANVPTSQAHLCLRNCDNRPNKDQSCLPQQGPTPCQIPRVPATIKCKLPTI